ncbi:MAG: hypothetical protein JWP63_6110 [Candidatus Solibacter sp.]|jgi:hypothetical protein|nr:hypothetical protein [Candidatus Solibacter sp.]
MALNALSNDVFSDRSRSTSTDNNRRRALARLYERRIAVDELIDSLERYQSAQSTRRASCVEITFVKK